MKIIIFVSIFLLFEGSIYAQSTDSISVKVVVSTQLFARKSVLIIKNDYSTSVVLRFAYNHSMDRGNIPDDIGTFLTVKTKNKISNEEHEDFFLINPSGPTLRMLKPDSVIEIPISLTYEDINSEKYDILDCYANIQYLTIDSEIKRGSLYRSLKIRPVVIELMGKSSITP